MPSYIKTCACISRDRRFRYCLSRVWDFALPEIAFVLLNPSTADSANDDPTVRRCVDYAQRWGYGSLSIYNLYAYRATDPRDLKKQGYPVGDKNDTVLYNLGLSDVDIIVAWGNGAQLERARRVMELIRRPVRCLAYNQNGSPHHPLRLPKDIYPIPWSIHDIQ